MPISLRTLCLVTAVLCNVQSLEHEVPRRSFLSRRAIDGTRGRKYFDPSEEGAFDSYGSAGGQYDPYDHMTDLSDIKKNVPGEPGIDYPAYSALPQTGFTCEGRSRGYYADEEAGCQVFHVCHDVLVSSFLCPIGSTFSQKLLTCDWWTKVDCSSTSRYLELNRNSYQIDDDEMIRNAYVMISLQSAEDLSKDGLVDPDSGARIIDYSALAGRINAGYTPGFRRITDYPSVDATGNDLPSGFEDYPQREDRRILGYDRYRQRTSPTLIQDKFQLEGKGRSPYHASPIIRHDYQDRSVGYNEYQDDYRRPDGFTNRLQASYAPTVPTVTTTTRRLYSPTVPTTYRPSTLAYSKLDLLMESSDHLYAHSKSLVTPPTIVRQNEDPKMSDLGGNETQRYDVSAKKSESALAPKTDGREDDEVGANLGEKSKVRFRINVTDAFDEEEAFRRQNEEPVVRYEEDEEEEENESREDIEAKDSIGIAQALNNRSRERIVVQSQDPVIRESKSGRDAPTTLSPSRVNADGSSGPQDDPTDTESLTYTLKKPNVVNDTDNHDSTENYEGVANSTSRSLEEIIYTRSLDYRTTPLLKNRDDRREEAEPWEPTALVTATSVTNTTERIVGETRDEFARHSSSNENQTSVDQNSSSTKSVPNFDHKTDPGFEVLRPSLFLRPPLESFIISIPEETRYSTDDSFRTSWSPEATVGVQTTTEVPPIPTVPSGGTQDVYNENIDELIDYPDESPLVTTPIPWLVPSWYDRSVISVPVTDIVPPIVDYSDDFGHFAADIDEPLHTAQFDHTEPVESPKVQNDSATRKNSSEIEILNQYNKGLQFTIRDAINARVESKVDSRPCQSSTSDERVRGCETSSVAPQVAASAPGVEKKVTPVIATTNIPEQLISLSNTRSVEKSVTPVPDESSTSITRSPIAINSNLAVEGSTLRTVTPQVTLQTKEPKEKVERTTVTTTTNSPPHPIRPGSLRQIEETIDRQNSPYEVTLTVSKDEDLDTTADDFISRLIARHQEPTSVLREQLGDFEILKSIEPEDEITVTSRTPKLPDTSHSSSTGSNSSLLDSSNNTAGQIKNPESNLSMLSLVQLMAELLKLDRLPRPFSMKDLRNAELGFPTNFDPDEPLFVTTNPLFDHSQGGTPFGNVLSRASIFDILNIPADVAETSATLDQNKQSLVTTSPQLDNSQAKTSFGKTNPKTPAFDTSRTNDYKSKSPLNLAADGPSSITANPLSDQLLTRTPFKKTNLKVSSFGDTLKTTSSVAFTSPPELPAREHPDHTTETKTIGSKASSKSNRPFQKQEILKQLTENFGQPLYRGDSVHPSLNFDLPQVQRSLNFETGLPVEESEPVIDEDEGSSEPSTTTIPATTTTTAASTTTVPTTTTQRTITTAESERTIVETEFVPSIGFSFDADEDREEYVEAVLGGLIDDHTGDEGRNEFGVEQSTPEAPKNETFRPEQHESSEEV